MTVGIPRALLYHRYGVLWETFFQKLDIPYVVSPPSNRRLLSQGIAHTVDESCLPLKLYMGHIASLLDQCDWILVPRFVRLGRRDEFCVRFWGLYDTVRATFPSLRLLSYALKSGRRGEEGLGFLKMGRALGKGAAASLQAYHSAVQEQREADFNCFSQGQALLHEPESGPKILLAAQPYIARDPLLGGVISRLIREGGGIPLTAEAWERTLRKQRSAAISKDLYWLMNRELLGAIHLARDRVDGVLLLSAFPCGSDCLANELVLRRVKDLPLIQILLDGEEGQGGLVTRIESFLDRIAERRAGG